MRELNYKNSGAQEELFIENTTVSNIAKAVGTPFYCYSKQALVENFNNFVDAFTKADITNYKICYAIKANYNIHLTKILTDLGAGIDAVSEAEIFRGIKANVDPKDIVFAGVGKTREAMEFALNNNVEQFSVESIAEMHLLSEVACKLRKRAKFSLRVNPNVDAKTHDKISTGRNGDKFGVDIELAEEIYAQAERLPGLEVHGISTHIGSQITTLEPFELAFEKIRNLCLKLRENGHTIESLDLGGGIGIIYNDEKTLPLDEYASLIKKVTKDLDVKVIIAPGRSISGTAGILATKVIFLKEAGDKKFAIIDAAMNDLARPGLYDSYHAVMPVVKKDGEKANYDLAGPVCETTDILAKNRDLTNLKSEDLLILTSAGAYGSSMSNEYNCRPMIPEILVDGDNFKVIRRRPTFEEMMHLED